MSHAKKICRAAIMAAIAVGALPALANDIIAEWASEAATGAAAQARYG